MAIVPPAHLLRPEVFEPFLEQHPEDLEHRAAALRWYGVYARTRSDKLREHTRAALRWHPDCPDCLLIDQRNVREFDLDPAYLVEVRESLEAAVRDGRDGHGLHANLGRPRHAGLIGAVGIPMRHPCWDRAARGDKTSMSAKCPTVDEPSSAPTHPLESSMAGDSGRARRRGAGDEERAQRRVA